MPAGTRSTNSNSRKRQRVSGRNSYRERSQAALQVAHPSHRAETLLLTGTLLPGQDTASAGAGSSPQSGSSYRSSLARHGPWSSLTVRWLHKTSGFRASHLKSWEEPVLLGHLSGPAGDHQSLVSAALSRRAPALTGTAECTGHRCPPHHPSPGTAARKPALAIAKQFPSKVTPNNHFLVSFY